jgi:Zn-dependent alcohol dehydrogenase
VIKVTAAVLHVYGGEFELEELELASPADRQLRVRIVATGFCHTDEKVRHGARSVPTPVVLGHEGAGLIEAVGRDVTELRAGDELSLEINPLLACRSLQGIVRGDAVPRRFIPMLIERYRRGQLPLDRLVSNYPLEQINRAAATRKRADASNPC